MNWNIVDGLSDGHTWFADDFTDPAGCASNDPDPPLGGTWAAVDSACAGAGVAMTEQLVTPLIDLTGILDVTLQFDHYFNWEGPETADVDVRSALTGGLWVNVGRWTADTANPEHVSIDISAHAADISTLQVRWHYYDGDDSFYWYVDNVAITYPVEAGCTMLECVADPPGPPPIPDGSPGSSPLLVNKSDSGGFTLELSWDDQCSPPVTNVIYGPLDQVSTYGVTAATCNIGNPVIWRTGGDGDLWFLLVGGDGVDVESSWGLAQGAERHGLTPSGTCGTTVKQIMQSCP
jgi:hypothetical protein